LVHDVCSEIKGEKVFLAKHDGLAHTIYESAADEEKPEKTTPPIIDEINEYLMENSPAESEDFTVERIAERTGINKSILYEWLEKDSEFTTALEQLKEVQKNDPFKTGTEEDTYVISMMIALLLLETRERHHKSENQ
jgi:hypothetical protein